MKGSYQAVSRDGINYIQYSGNKIFPEVSDVRKVQFTEDLLKNRVADLRKNEMFSYLHEIDNGIFFAAIDYFREIRSQWCNLPLTTLMISSPGEVYAGKVLDYTTDTLPVELSWFDSDRRIFLSESSQFYLELRLLVEKVDKVFSIYNSFRKEKADFSHLSEFQHIEFEGHVSFNENIQIANELIHTIVSSLVQSNASALQHFLTDKEISELAPSLAPANIPRITAREALNILLQETGDEKYREFSLKHFGAWEEIRLTEIFNSHLWITNFPMMEIPFYHRAASHFEDGVPTAENADLILRGSREVIGTGVRMSDSQALQEKARIFNLPPEDYEPYLQMRALPHYKPSAGFGLGWQRLTHWLLRMPVIWETMHVPRGHILPRP